MDTVKAESSTPEHMRTIRWARGIIAMPVLAGLTLLAYYYSPGGFWFDVFLLLPLMVVAGAFGPVFFVDGESALTGNAALAALVFGVADLGVLIFLDSTYAGPHCSVWLIWLPYFGGMVASAAPLIEPSEW